MPKSRKQRIVTHPPGAYEYVPSGAQTRPAARVVLSIDEYEALRLVDYMGLDHTAAAEQMEITRPNCTRAVASAHRKIAEALTEGKTIAIDGERAAVGPKRFRCGTCGHLWSETEPIEDPDALRCPRCNGSRIIDLSEPGGWVGGRYR